MKNKILVIDDDAGIRDFLVRLLKKSGYETIQANDGKTALAMVKEETPDLAILDYRMTLVDGLEVLRQIKAFDAGIKVIMLTGFATDGLAKSARDFGADGFLEKGMPNDLLIKSIEDILRKQEPGKRNLL